jgi:TP901 family phage tail tape measure protein
MSDFSVTVGGDFSELLAGFRKLEQDARASGQNVGKGIAEGIQGFSTKSLAALQAELNRLQSRQTRVAVDSSAFEKTGQKIKEVQALISEVERKRLAVGVDDRSVTALQTKLAALQNKQTKVSVDSQDFLDLQRDIDKLEGELDAISRRKLLINADGNSVLALTLKIRGELDALQQKQIRLDVDSQEFADVGREIDRLEGDLQAIERKRTEVNIDSKSLVALQGKLAQLQQQQTRVSVDSQEFVDLERQINRVQQEIGEIERKRLLITADTTSISGLNAKLQALQDELQDVAIGSQRFRELQVAIKDTERALEQAGQAVDGFNLIDGAIQGLAFSLTNTVTNAAGQALAAIGGLVSGFAALDTEIRQAAAAAGEDGGYDKIARSIDTVGIEAAGTQQEVAQLATELIRGGMTVDQMNDSLGAIVRGAEATGTGFAQMGSVVSASLKGFGLQASDAKRVVDALVTGANASASSVDGMGMAFKYAAPVARILGVSVEELGIAVGLLTNAGIDASEAGVTLRNGLSKLASAAPQTGGSMQKLTGQAAIAADTMKQLGINIYNADGTLQPMETTLLKLKGAFEKLDPASKIRLASNLFGGEDDGTKWLALLNQSEEEIRKMATTMANTKGATDTARDAMQGFQMQMNQLTGTLDSLGKTLGGVAAAALTPFLNLANQIVGVVAGLPTPVKATAAALIIMAGAAATATAAIVLFQRAMTVTVIQTAAAEIKALAVTMTATLATAVKGVIAVIPGLLTQLSLIGSLNVGTVVTALATALKTALVNGFAAASAAVVQFVAYLKSADFAAFIAGVRSATLALAPLAAGLAALTGAVIAWQQVLGGAKEGTEAFAGAQEEADKIVAGFKGTIQSTTAAIKPWWQSMLEGLPIIGDVGLAIKGAREEMMMLGAAKGLENLQASYTKVQVPAIAFLNTLRTSTAVTAEQSAQALMFAEAARQIKESAEAAAAGLRAKAEAAERGGNVRAAEQYRQEANALDAESRASGALAAALTEQANRTKDSGKATADKTKLTEAQIKANKELAKAEAELNKIISEAPVRRLESQLAVGEQLLDLTKAIVDLEESRFNVTRSALQFELEILEEREAGEAAIAAKKAEIDQVDRAALSARYQALIQQQALEQQMLTLSQKKAQIEANLEMLGQRTKVMEATKQLMDAMNSGDQVAVELAQRNVAIQEAMLGVSQEKVNLLAQIQPIEQASAAATAEIARNGLQAEAAAKGYAIAADGSLVKVQGVASSLENVRTLSGASAQEQERFRNVAAQACLAIEQAADGTLVLGRCQEDVNRAVGEMNSQLGQAKGGFDGVGQAAGGAKAQTDLITQALAAAGGEAKVLSQDSIKKIYDILLRAGFKAEDIGDILGGTTKQSALALKAALAQAGVPMDVIVQLLGEAGNKAKDAKGQTDALKNSLGQGKTPAEAIATAFVSVEGKAPRAAQGARDFAAWLSKAKEFGEKINNLNLDKGMRSVRDATRQAASAAKDFYNYLRDASNLPGSRWTGGPVEAGGEYRINELGQEAFLSAGRVSLINAPQNAIWRAPSAGVVIPAGITARMQEAGALPAVGGGSVAGVAELALEVGKLRQEVAGLARKDWSIHVQQRTGPTASQVMSQIHRLR